MEIGDVLVEIELTSLMERLVVDVPEVEDRLEEKSQRKHENTRLKTWRDDPFFLFFEQLEKQGKQHFIVL